MSKEVTYSVVARKNMLKKDDPAKYYAQAQASGDVGLDEISTRVEKACTVHSADVVAVLKALEDEMVDGLSRGEIVRLGNIGTFQVGLRSRGAEKAEEFKAANISKARVNFRPGPVLADAMKTLNFSKVSTRAAQKGDGGGDGDIVRNFNDLSVNPEIKILYTIVPGIKILYQLENKDSVLLCVLCGVNVKQLNIAKQR